VFPVQAGRRMWLQHDGAPPHFGRDAAECLMQIVKEGR